MKIQKLKMKNILRLNQGMTLIEIIVVISIFSIISSVVMFRGGDFAKKISIQNLAQDVALSIKTAQAEALSGRAVSPNGIVFSEGSKITYGIHFNNSNTFYYFADIDNDSTLTGASANSVSGCKTAGSECLSEFTLSGGSITNICFNKKTTGSNNCYAPSDLQSSILFTRPFPDAVIRNSVSGITNFSDISITISTPDGQFVKTIYVFSTGQISVE